MYWQNYSINHRSAVDQNNLLGIRYFFTGITWFLFIIFCFSSKNLLMFRYGMDIEGHSTMALRQSKHKMQKGDAVQQLKVHSTPG